MSYYRLKTGLKQLLSEFFRAFFKLFSGFFAFSFSLFRCFSRCSFSQSSQPVFSAYVTACHSCHCIRNNACFPFPNFPALSYCQLCSSARSSASKKHFTCISHSRWLPSNSLCHSSPSRQSLANKNAFNVNP